VKQRDGFVLLAVVGTLTLYLALAVATLRRTSDFMNAASYRLAEESMRWDAEGCLARLRAALADNQSDPGVRQWLAPPAADAASRAVNQHLNALLRCGGMVSLRPSGLTLDVNLVSAQGVRRALSAFRIASPQNDSLVDALLDWRDVDDSQRTHGCESRCYRELGMAAPRNGALLANGELAMVRGFGATSLDSSALDLAPGLSRLFSVGEGRVAVNWASVPVLASLPGVEAHDAARIVAARAHGQFVRDLSEVISQRGLAAGVEERTLYRLATIAPDSWVFSVTLRTINRGEPRVEATFVARVVLRDTDIFASAMERQP